MEKYYPGLDVDNLVNLKLSCTHCNHKERNFLIDSSIALMHSINSSAGVISLRLHSVLEKLNGSRQAIQMSLIDPRICTNVLHVSHDELKDISSDWRGAMAISRKKLEDRVRQAMKQAFEEGGAPSIYTTLGEAIDYFRDSIQINGSTVISSGKRQPAWWVEANSYFFSDRGPREPLSEADSAMKAADGIYLDSAEVAELRGMVIPLRTESQRWFRDVFVTIVSLQRKIDSQYKPRHVVLGEHEYRALLDCFQKLTIVASGINGSGRRLKRPETLANFATYQGVLEIYPDSAAIPESVKQLCRAEGETSIWGDGAILSKSQLKSWLANAFHLANMGVQAVTGSDLVRIEDASFGYSWVPPLPNIKGKTRKEVQAEDALKWAPRARGRKRRGPTLSAG
ncbi:hypothetical protein CY652_07760 [Burkholderia sp. WAC0059]|nr:hypothetical protein CY652_07760 [Burkholderia sp. WAC0059]